MERITETAWRNLDPWECCGQDNYCKRGCYDDGGCIKGCIVPKLYERLATYEDTGLSPDEIKELLHDSTGPMHKKLGEWIDAEREGRLVILPDNYDRIYARIGDNTYAVVDGEVHEYTVTGICVNEDGILVIDCFEMDICWYEENGYPVEEERPIAQYVPVSYVGKTVFLTREEAEAALKGGAR